MAVIAIVVAGDVRRVFARCSKSVMTGAAVTQHLCVIHRVGGGPDAAVMAVLTDVGCLHMRKVFASGIQTIVAAHAIASDVQVVERRRPPRNRRMAVVAGIAAGEVRRVLASRDNAIVTGAADADDLGMVNGKHGRKNVGVMAVLADVAGQNMRKILTNCVHAVMAVNTASCDVQVIKIGG